MDRRLLPYEYQLIEALGVSKEEYLEFVALQQEYKDVKVGTALDVRNTGTEVAIVLTVVGILFQVGAALLAPKPNIPDLGADNKRRNRQQRFSPSSGFNGAPELASYGDPVNLVYTERDDNPDGGVRVSGSLVWSSIENYGSAQFMQLLFVLGAARIINISNRRTAFGSLSVDQLDPSTTFLFYKNGGPPSFKDLARGDLDFYPDVAGRSTEEDRQVCQIITSKKAQGTGGFSQAYSPTTSSSLGIYDPIPVRVEMTTRDTEGEEQFAPIGITLETNDWTRTDYPYPKNSEIKVRFESKDYTDGGDDEAVPLALNFRRQAVNALDFGSTYMLGSAKFRLISFGESRDPDDDDVNATFKCVESGICPSAPYNRESALRQAKEQKKKLERHLKIITDKREDSEETIPGSSFDTQIRVENRFSASANKETLDESDDKDQYNTTPFENNYTLSGRGISYDFKTPRTVSWISVLDQKRSQTIEAFGSMEYTKYLEATVLGKPPTVDAAEYKREIRSDLRKADRLIAEIQDGKYDDDFDAKRKVPDIVFDIGGTKYRNITLAEAIDLDFEFDSEADGSKKYNGIKGRLFDLTGQEDETLNRIDRLRGKIDPNLEKSKRLKDTAFNQNTKGDPVRFAGFEDLTDDKSIIARGVRQERKLKKIRQRIAKRNKRIVERKRDLLVQQLLDHDGAFFGIDGNRYGDGGKAQMKSRLDNFPSGKRVPDPAGVEALEDAFRKLKKQKKGVLRDIKVFLNEWNILIARADNNFFVKALVKADSVAYETVSEVDQVKFSIKSKLFRRMSGRQKKYGEVKASKDYSLSDNGIHGRQAFFRFSYKRAKDKNYNVHEVLFIVRGSSESEAYNDFNYLAPDRDKYAFKLDPVYDVASELRLNGQTIFVLLDSHEKVRKTGTQASGVVWYKGKEYISLNDDGWPNLQERGPKLTNEWDVFSVNTDTQVQFSFESGPELALTAVSEQQIENTEQKYKNLSVLALGMFAGRSIQDLRNVTAFVEQGKQSYTVDNFNTKQSDRSTSYAPDIFVDTVLDEENGIGKYAPSAVLDQASLQLAKRFCQNNNLPTEPEDGVTPPAINLFMDCVIADNTSWRDFWVSSSPFSLLEFARKNGKETLVPVVPCDAGGKAAEADGKPVPLTISALFTTGNILEDSYKEEFLDYGANTQDLIASIVYREEFSKSIFQRKRTVEVKRKGIVPSTSIRETFDASGFITTRQQAIMFGKMLVNQRRFIKRGIEFKTFPSANPIEPGAFIYVDIGLTTWERTSSGVIAAGGALNSPLQDSIPSGTYNFLVYDRSKSEINPVNSVVVSNGVASALSDKVGQLYVMGVASGKKRVFRITEVELDEEGEVTVRAMEYPCDDEDRAHVADFRPSLFEVS